MAQWIEQRPVNQRAAGSIPCLEHMPGLRAKSPVGGAQETPHIDVSLSSSLPLSLKINLKKIFLIDEVNIFHTVLFCYAILILEYY